MDRAALRKSLKHGVSWAVAALIAPIGVAAQARRPDIVIDAPAAIDQVGQRVRRIDLTALERSLSGAGLPMPGRISITLVTRDDPRAVGFPPWIVGLAFGTADVVIFPERIGPYPHDSLEAVVRHEIVHLALNTKAGGRPLPRWFHEGAAVRIESGWRTRDEMRLLLAALDPPSLADIGRLFRSDAYPDTTQAYLLATALVDEICQRQGANVIGAVAGLVAAGQPFDEAFEAATNETPEEAAARAWRAHRQLSRWFPVVTSPSAVWTVILVLAMVAFVSRIRRRRSLRRRWPEDEDDPGEDWEDVGKG